jgi:hypothetical protein
VNFWWFGIESREKKKGGVENLIFLREKVMKNEDILCCVGFILLGEKLPKCPFYTLLQTKIFDENAVKVLSRKIYSPYSIVII